MRRNIAFTTLIALLCSCALMPACARKTGSLQVGADEPGLEVDGDSIRLNPDILGYESESGFTIDTYSNGEISIKMRGRPRDQTQAGGEAW